MQSAFDIFFANGPGLPQNDLIAKFSVNVPTEVTVCSNDSFPEKNGNKHGVVKYFCLDCWKALCVECCIVHFKTKVTEQHKVRLIASIDEADISTRRRQLLSHCSLHKDEKLVKFCYQCQDVICSSCFTGDHTGHDCVELETFDKVIAQELRKEQEEILQHEVFVSKQMQSIESKIKAVDNNKSEKLFKIQEHVAKLLSKACEAYMKIIAKINDVEEEAKKNVLEEVAKHKKRLSLLQDTCENKMNKLHQINSAFDIILNPLTPVVEQCQFSILWLDSEILPRTCSEELDPALTNEMEPIDIVYVPVRVNFGESSSDELQVEATLSVPQLPLRAHENKIGVHVSQNYTSRHSAPMTSVPVAVPGQYVSYNLASQPIQMNSATSPNLYSQQQMFVQQVQPGATPRMPTPAQYQMTPNMQQAQQQHPQQQVCTQYQQAMTVGQQQQQQVPQYASQQVPVVATASAPVPQFHPPAQPPSQPTQQKHERKQLVMVDSDANGAANVELKRERKPLVIVNSDSNGAVNIGNTASAVAGREVAVTQHRTPERTTPQPTPSLPSSIPAPTNADEIQAQFAARLAARMHESSQSEGSHAQSPLLITDNNVTGSNSKLKPQDTASSANSKQVAGLVTAGLVIAKEPTPTPVTTTTVTRNHEPRTVVRCTYAEGQWSPSNPSGKKRYSVEFLLQFKDVYYQQPLELKLIPGCTARPDDSPFYRARMCHYFKACIKGDEHCIYAHKPEDLRPKPKWRMCRNVEHTGYCIHGDECVFAHTAEEMNEAKEARRRSENENMT